MAKRLSDGTLTFDSKEEAREWEREMNWKAGVFAFLFVLLIGLPGILFLINYLSSR